MIFYIIDLDSFYAAIRQADYRYILTGIGLTVLWVAVRSIAWRTMLREQASFSQVFFTVNEGYVLNNILPFRLGEIGRAFILSKKASIGFWEVFSSIILERVIDLAFAAGLLFVSIPFVVGADWASEAAIGVAILVFVGFVMLVLLARNRRRGLLLFNGLSEKIPILKKFGSQRVEAFFDGLIVLTDVRRSAQVIGLMTLNWTIGIFQYYLLLLAFFPEAQLHWATFVLGVAAVGVAAPSSPASLGVFELLVTGALTAIGVDESAALAFAVTTHTIQIAVTGLFGAIGFFRDGESLLDIYRRSRQIPQTPE